MPLRPHCQWKSLRYRQWKICFRNVSQWQCQWPAFTGTVEILETLVFRHITTPEGQAKRITHTVASFVSI